MSSSYRPGDIVPFTFHGGIIVASYFVSLIGSITTVELLHRKKEGKKWYLSRWVQQLAVSVSFGLVAIWCMHFVGNRAIVLGDGDKSLQLYYNPGFTALSAILPIIFLFCGLTTVEVRQPGQRFFWPALVIAGIVAGLAITGMHYIGNFGVQNYKLGFPAGYVVGAAAIAICASLTALALFFYFQERWINSLPRRLGCALLLAGAVSGMHWVASVGTTYQLLTMRPADDVSGRDTNLIVAIVISFVAVICCLAFAFLTQRRKKELADRAQHVVLASATFDTDGRLLVTQEGLMPCQKITKQYNQKSFNDEFNIAHPVFQWLYRVTFNWSSVIDLIPAMRHHLRVAGTANLDTGRPMTPSPERSVLHHPDDPNEDYSILFRENFCVAAAQLADSLKTPVNGLGVMYNGIMSTGSLSSEYQPRKRRFRNGRRSVSGDLETGPSQALVLGKGQLLFLVRQVDKQESQRLISDGFRFAQIGQVSDIIARSMQIAHTDLVQTIEKLRKYCTRKHETLSGSIYLAAFVMRPALKASSQGWEILVPTQRPTQLPMVELSQEPLTLLQQKSLSRLDGLSVNQCLAFLNNTLADVPTEEERDWIEQLLDQVSALVVDVPEQFFGHAIFSAKPVRVLGVGTYDSAPQTVESQKPPIQLYAFSIIPDIHTASIKSTNKVVYTPLSFFRCSQRVYKGSRDHAILARKIHREFATVLAELQRQHPMVFSATRVGSRKDSLDKSSSSVTDSVYMSTAASGKTPMDSDRPLSRLSNNIMELPIISSLRSRSPLPVKGLRSHSRADRNSDGSEAELVEAPVSQLPPTPRSPAFSIASSNTMSGSTFNPLGGIMVSSDTTVEVQPREVFESGSEERSGTSRRGKRLEMTEVGMGITSEAGVGAKEEPTYVDELYRMATLRWTKQ